MPERFVRLLGEHRGIQFFVALTVIVVLKWHALVEPPGWDTAMGLFPAALTLVENNFDLLELLAMPAYLQGGPNTHATSVVTLFTAVVLKATGGGGQKSFLVLHLLHFAVAAYALVALFSFAKPVFGRSVTAVYCLAVLLFPVFSAQVGYLYLEIPLFLCAVSALRAWMEQRFWAAVLWAAAAFAVKEPGIIVSGALAVATLLENRHVGQKAKRLALILAPLLILGGVGTLLDYLAAPEPIQDPARLSLGQAFLSLFHYLDRYVFNVPDLWVFIVVFIAAVPMFGPSVLKALRRGPSAGQSGDSHARAHLVLGYSAIIIVLFMLTFTIALPVLFRFAYLLPRYFVIVAPFLLLWVGYVVSRVSGARSPVATPACFALLSVFFAINANGVFYPSDIDTRGPGNDPALTERSNAYRRLLGLEVQAIRALQALPAGVPVYYGHYEHYLLNYPGLGYASAPLSNGHNLFLETFRESIGEDTMAPCIYALYNYPGLGGERIAQLIKYADDEPHLSSEIIQEFRNGRYALKLVRIQKDGSVCPK